MYKTTRMDHRLVVEPIAHSTTDGRDFLRGRGSATVSRTFEFRKKKIGVWIAALIRSKTKSNEPIEIVVRKRDRREFLNKAHSDTSQRDRSARPSRAEWMTLQSSRDLRVEKEEMLEIDPEAGCAFLVRPAKLQGLEACLQAARPP